jgi:lipopolysaccharide export system protein LptA
MNLSLFASPSLNKKALLLAGLAAMGLFAHSYGAARRKTPVRRAAASAPARQMQTYGAYQFGVGPSGEVTYESIKGGGVRFELTGDAELPGPGRAITAQIISFDVPKGNNDISVARASGNVHLAMRQTNGQKLTAETPSLLFRRDSGLLTMDGGVHIHSDLEAGGSVDATGQNAQIQTGPQTAVLNGNVQLTLMKPDTLEGPAHFSGQKMTVDLTSGNWKLSGGKGNFNLKPQALKPKPGTP